MKFLWGKKDDNTIKDAFVVRYEVFVSEQGFSPNTEIDNIDDTALHLIGYDHDGQAVCAARLFCEHGNVWHAGRIAVNSSHRGNGTGRLLMTQLAQKAKEQNATSIILGAQYDKAGFYEKCGYIKSGKEFLDEGYPHVEMTLTL